MRRAPKKKEPSVRDVRLLSAKESNDFSTFPDWLHKGIEPLLRIFEKKLIANR